MTGNDHDFEQTADPLELAEIKRRWNPYPRPAAGIRSTVCEELLKPGKVTPPA